MRRASLILGKRSGDPQREAMLKRLGILEEPPAPAQVQREPLFSYSAPRLVEPALPTPVLDVPSTTQAANDRPPPPVNVELELMRAELAEMRQQFSALPIQAPRRRRRKRLDVVKGVRLAIWFVAVAVAAFVTFTMLKTSDTAPKPDHILAAAVGP
jgi:hypothetical protein